jgi:predicted transcriptional regulator of viral defense system
MPRELPAACRELLAGQGGIISRRQALRAGVSENTIDGRLRSGAWQQLHHGVYATFTGEPPRRAWLWAAALRSGPGAALSHQTAAELFQLTDTPSPLIHVTIPAGRRVRGVAGIRVHRSSRIMIARHPSLLPPRTRVEETVVDLTQTARTFDEAFHWLCHACGSRCTTAERLGVAVGDRKHLRRRDALLQALAAIGDGVHSNLEYRHVRGVERPHGLPVPRRQARIAIGRGHRYLDNLYEEFGVAVELDGRAAHLAGDRWRDVHRDNASAGLGIITLRYNWADVTERACDVAAEIAAVLHQRGWPGRPHPCGRTCRIRFALP